MDENGDWKERDVRDPWQNYMTALRKNVHASRIAVWRRLDNTAELFAAMLFHVPDRDHVFEPCAAGVFEDRMDEASVACVTVGDDLGECADAYCAFRGQKCKEETPPAVPCLGTSWKNAKERTNQ